MSQDQPNSQPPSPEPGANQPENTAELDQRSAAGSGGDVEQSQTIEKTSNRAQTLLKAQSIKALRGTIQVLEGVLVKLEAEPLDATTTPSFLDKLQSGWSGILAKIRSLLPENLNQKLSDTGLTAMIAVVVAIGVWITSVLLGKPTEIASVPTETPTPTADIVANVPTETPTPTAEIATPPELTAPAAPQPIEVVPPPPVPTPTPTLELTPEQSLIASIQNRVAEITDQYANGLIQSIQANFQGSSLIIKVGDDWYSLQQSQQDKLAARMLERAKELDFSRLEITDPQGTLLARSPVVGNDMVILKRQAISDQPQAAKG
jgi:hypothetical protein